MKRLGFIVLFCGLVWQALGAVCAQGTAAQPLSEGRWFRVAVTRQGMYRLTPSFLRSAGIATGGIDPTRLSCYAQPGGPLPQLDPSPVGLSSYAIHVVADADASFEEGEYVLFYAESPHTYHYDADARRYEFMKNPYSDTLFYYFRVDGDEQVSVPVQEAPTDAPTQTLQNYAYVYTHELDQSNRIRSGRRWYGERFNDVRTSYSFSLPKRPETGSEVVLMTALAAGCRTPCSIDVSLQGRVLGSESFPTINILPYARVAWHREQVFRATANDASPSINFRFNGGSLDDANLDRFVVQYNVPLRYTPGNTLFFRHMRSLTATSVLRYEINNANASSNLLLWDISNPFRSKSIPLNPLPSGQGSFFDHQPEEGQDSPTEFVLFDPGRVFFPLAPQPIANLSLPTEAELLIVTAPGLRVAANRLADFHRTRDAMRVAVVTTTEVYHAYAAGRCDPTAIRNYARELYARGDLRYLLLFGGATFDYRMRLGRIDMHVPSYASYASLNPTSTYVSDDYFGFLSPEEGRWRESPPEDHTMDIGVGRLPARSKEQAKVLVDKIYAYDQYASRGGPWRQDMYFVADDGDNNIHHRDIERLADYLEVAHPEIRVNRLYLDNYKQERRGSLQRSSAASQAIDRAIEQGSLVINFSGHGNTQIWTAEAILSPDQIQRWTNIDRLPLFITATCDFGRHDDPFIPSAGEKLLFSSQGGGIALLSTARPVFADANFALNDALIRELYKKDADGRHLRLGDILRETKNNSLFGVGNRGFSLLGDPALRLAYPRLETTLTHINGQALAEGEEVHLRARSLVRVQGEVRRNETYVPNYEGTMRISVYDKANTLRTLGDQSSPFSYPAYNSLVFQGEASIQEGRFSFEFIVPQTLSYRPGMGRMYFYFTSGEENTPSGVGGYRMFSLGGPAVRPAHPDDTGPVIEAWLNQKLLAEGMRVSPKATLRLRLTDPSGIKLTQTGPAKNFSFSIDGGEPIDISSYYVAAKDSYQEGNVIYSLPKLASGWHTLTVTVWDNYDNPSRYVKNFFSSSHTPIALKDVKVYPNPIKGNETFISFTHDKLNNSLEISLALMSVEGKRVLNKTWLILVAQRNNISVSFPNDLLRGLQTGVYIYKLSVVDQDDGTRGSAEGRVIVGR